MKISKINRKLRCEMPNCKNVSEYKLEKEGFFRNAGMYLCDDCVKEIYKCLSGVIVPKSPDNMLNKKVKVAKEKVIEK